MISNIMSTRHGILWKTIQLFSKREKTGNMTEFKLTNFRRLSFGNDIAKCNIYIIATSVLDFKQLYIFYKFCPKKQIHLSDRTLYLVQIFTCSRQIWFHITKTACVFRWKLKFKVFVNCRR